MQANIVVTFVSHADIGTYCGYQPAPPAPPNTPRPACNNVADPTTIWLDDSLVMVDMQRLLRHELGHSLWYDDQYYSDGHCANGQSQSGGAHGSNHANYSSIMDCESLILENPDENDFRTRYEPTLQNANPTYPDTWVATWNPILGGAVPERFPNSFIEWAYYWRQESDTGGSLISDGYTFTPTQSQNFAYVVGSRYCIFSKIHNTVGYPGGRSWSPRSQYSCIGAPQSQSAGFLLATSDRNNPATNNLYIRVKNFAGWGRNVGIFGYIGPGQLADIGCGYENINHLATRQCYITLARQQYSALARYAWDGSILSWGYLDFE